MTKVVVSGVAGRMGQRIVTLIHEDPDLSLVGGTEACGHPSVGGDLGAFSGLPELGIEITDNIENAATDADVIVDFTNPASTLETAAYAAQHGKALVIGTTGFSETEITQLNNAATSCPIVYSPNMSIGVNVLFQAAKQVASALGDDYDVEIVEAHHKHKVDSPSGTALRLGKVVADALNRDFGEVAKFERHGQIGEREKNEIGMQTIRGGDTVGEHTVLFFGSGERIELTHRAYNRDTFARGVIRAVKWIENKKPGIYSMLDVLGF